jgi:hypothetical protein
VKPFGMRTYGVRASSKAPLIGFMTSALEESGCRIIHSSSPEEAPFILTFETPIGERIGIVVYAFLATRTKTTNRPIDERSFQIKYGSKKSNEAHKLWSDPYGLFTTLLVGIDTKENFFVAADPVLHNPTKFFIRMEFKDRHADEIKSRGWAVWERDRRSELDENPVEVLVGGSKSRFLDYIRFERAAANLSVGDRHLLAERPNLWSSTRGTLDSDLSVASLDSIHPLSQEFKLDPEQILELISGARRLKMAVRGWVAEEHLRRFLSGIAGVSECERIDLEGGADIQLRYLGRRPLTIECKNVLRLPDANNRPRIDFQRTRASKSNPCSRFYSVDDFDLLAGCLHAVTERWEFRFARTSDLPPHKSCEGKVASNVRIDSSWLAIPEQAFESVYASNK